jgi:hypothetical protein
MRDLSSAVVIRARCAQRRPVGGPGQPASSQPRPRTASSAPTPHANRRLSPVDAVQSTRNEMRPTTVTRRAGTDHRSCSGGPAPGPRSMLPSRLCGSWPADPRRLRDRVALFDDEPGQPQAGTRGQGSVSVGHEGLRSGAVPRQLHSATGGLPTSRSLRECRHTRPTNVSGQHIWANAERVGHRPSTDPEHHPPARITYAGIRTHPPRAPRCP